MPRAKARGGDHLSGLCVPTQFKRPTRGSGRFCRETSYLPPEGLPLLGLAPDGGCLAHSLLNEPVVSYTTFSPLLRSAVCFCGPIRQVTPPRVLPGVMLFGVRTFLGQETAALFPARDHPTGLGKNIILSGMCSVNLPQKVLSSRSKDCRVQARYDDSRCTFRDSIIFACQQHK